MDSDISAIESALMENNLKRLDSHQRLMYMQKICEDNGLNPLTQPFQYIVLNGKLTLYATKGCADQLRAVKGVSIEILQNEIQEEHVFVHVKASMPDERQPSGVRTDEDIGVTFVGTGMDAINNRMKAVTKAKRRLTLSICGLGFTDESELESIPSSAVRQFVPPAEEKPVKAIPQTAAFKQQRDTFPPKPKTFAEEEFKQEPIEETLKVHKEHSVWTPKELEQIEKGENPSSNVPPGAGAESMMIQLDKPKSKPAAVRDALTGSRTKRKALQL